MVQPLIAASYPISSEYFLCNVINWKLIISSEEMKKGNSYPH